MQDYNGRTICVSSLLIFECAQMTHLDFKIIIYLNSIGSKEVIQDMVPGHNN
jgi:hypothetical protein